MILAAILFVVVCLVVALSLCRMADRADRDLGVK